MEFNTLHLSHPHWIWAGIVIPFVWIFYFFFYKTTASSHQLEKFVDKHLLPYLLISSEKKEKKTWLSMVLWSLGWALLVFALTGPQWNYREVETFSKDQSIVLLLDLSESMNANDSKPSRLSVAKQKIEDILRIAKGVKIGLVAFAADPHMIAPITDDHEMLQSILPSLTTDLVYIQGSRLSPALVMAENMLGMEPGENKSIVVLSDGGFEDGGAIKTAKELAQKGIRIYTFGIGTLEGTLLQPKSKADGKPISPIVTKLEKERLGEISKISNGRYLESHYSHDEEILLDDVRQRSNPELHIGQKKQIWDEYFYLFILPVLPLLLWWFRKGSVIACFILFFSSASASCGVYEELFLTQEERGKKAYEEKNFDQASAEFQDPYRKGVACYRLGNFSDAEKCFLASSRPEVAAQALYNLGNTYVQQGQFEKAIAAYEKVLASWPDHLKAKENLEIVKKLLEQQEQQKEDEEKQKDSSNKEEQSQKNDQKEEESEQQNQKEENEKKSDEQEFDQEQTDNKEIETKNPQEEKSESEKESDEKADFWLNQISSDPKKFLQNKFYIESKKNMTTEGVDPW